MTDPTSVLPYRKMLCKDGSVCRCNLRRGYGVVGGGRRGVVVEVIDGRRRKLEDEVTTW
jgi:hypothetical protein